MTMWLYALGTTIRWASLLPTGYCPPCRPEVREFLGYGSREIVFDHPALEGLHQTDGMRKAILNAGLTPREGSWKRFQGRYNPKGPILITPTSSLSVKDLPHTRWGPIVAHWRSKGFDVQWQSEGTLRELEQQIRRCALVVGSDTGPLHLADYMNIPVLGLYGFTRPDRQGPLGQRSRVLFNPTGVAGIEDHQIVEAAYKMLGG